MVWMRKSNACQMKRTRKRDGVAGSSARREIAYELARIATTARREMIVVVSMRSRTDIGTGGAVVGLLMSALAPPAVSRVPNRVENIVNLMNRKINWS